MEGRNFYLLPSARGKLCAVALLFSLSLFGFSADSRAQSSSAEDRGFEFYEQVEGSSNSLGQVIRWDSSVGYDFNRYFSVDGGLPVYFVRPSSSATANGSRPANGLGDVYADVRFTFDNPVVNFVSTLTGTAPTGDTESGLGTGSATWHWDNHFDRQFGRWIPFADVGLANSISDTRFFVRPFSTLGTVGEFEAGTEYHLWGTMRLGASAYDVVPTGEQKLFSRLIKLDSGAGTGPPGAGGHGRAFELAGRSVGNADLTRDNGFSAWWNARALHVLDFELGYSRSIHFRLNTVFFGVGVDLGRVIRHARGG